MEAAAVHYYTTTKATQLLWGVHVLNHILLPLCRRTKWLRSDMFEQDPS
jgi:hypothetical protein